MKKYFIGSLVALIVVLGLGFFAFKTSQDQSYKAAPGQGTVYTTAGGFAAATTTVGTAAVQIFASINQLAFITNNTTNTVTCSLDARGTTAASSSIVAGRGVIIGSNAGTIIPARVQFGQCVAGSADCFPHTGAVNCVASASTTITTLIQ